MNSIEANGARIPAIGLGTMTLKEQVCIDTVKTALKLGYRHLDTAERYGNEEWVGEGLRQGLAEQGLKREDVFVTTKVYWDKLAPGDFEKSVEQSLEKTEPLVNNQIEVHPFLDQSKVIAACKKYGLSVTGYCPIARGKVPGNETLERIGKAHGKSSSQVALRYLVQQGVIPIPRTATPAHLEANLALEFTLTPAEMAEIAKLAKPDGRVVNPAHSPQWDS
jgi:diketogulonate reductase-like aldo/keto reductase